MVTLCSLERVRPRNIIAIPTTYSGNEGLYMMSARGDQTMRSIMWWGLLMGGLTLAAFAVEMIESRWLSRKARHDLSVLQTRMRSHHRWDAARGNWQT
jgi:hypothetical protein